MHVDASAQDASVPVLRKVTVTAVLSAIIWRRCDCYSKFGVDHKYLDCTLN